MSIGLLPCPDNGNGTTKKSCNLSAETFKAVVQLKSCRFWNDSKWMTKGCRVSTYFDEDTCFEKGEMLFNCENSGKSSEVYGLCSITVLFRTFPKTEDSPVAF